MTPSVTTTVVTLSGLGLSFAALALSAAGRLRDVAARAESTRRLEELAQRVAALEARSVEATAAGRGPSSAPEPVRRVDPAGRTAVAGPTLIAVPDLSARRSAPSAREPGPSDLGQRFSTVWEMADAGEAAEAIARATGQPIGQVELILGLKRQLGTSAAQGRHPS